MADRDDNYRGYGRPSGRYYEGRDYGRSGYGGGGYGSDRGREGYRGERDDDRGFFERAGEEIRSWFSDDDDRPRERGYGDRDRERSYGAFGMGGRGREEGRGRDDYRYGGQRSGGSAYGASGYGSSGSYGNSSGGYGQRREGSHPHDEHYGEWRRQQMSELDRDYDEYRTENRDRFQNEFTAWRGQRQQQRSSVQQVKEHMEVVGSDGQPVGTVDKVAGDKIILTKNGAMAGGHHHSIPCSWLQSVDDKVTINKTAEEARKQWTDEENRRALFESEDQRRSDGPHNLDRSFSGTYER